ncbi:polysaccharide biosynthesis/export family protein [Asticcacaulis solisilvae]|uniref:polysaccharide biosynthesis/export family protein n=1 Tax=Asticcacaulis solisilvae TaxID=1217274 RepID=UPI003FD7D0F3
MKKAVFGAFVLGVSAALVLSWQSAAMAQVPTVPLPTAAPPQPAVAAAPAVPEAGAGSSNNAIYTYRLSAGDKLSIAVFGEPDLGGAFTVTGEGKIAAPLIGDVYVMGMSASEVQATLETKYRQGYLKDPKVQVQFTSYRPFYILGEVKTPGEYAYDSGMTVVKAVALAQGFTYRADQKKVYIKHVNATKEIQVPLTSTQTVEPGDTVRIGERYF